MGKPVKVERLMTVEEFLQWDSGDDYVWELIDGVPRLKDPPNPELEGAAAPSDPHGVIQLNLGSMLASALRSNNRPCRTVIGGAQPVARRRNRIPDILVKCGDSARAATDTILVVEILSPSNTAVDLSEREADYRAVASLREILLVEQSRPVVTRLRRVGDLWRTDRIEGLAATVALDSIGADLPMLEIYRDVLDPEDWPEWTEDPMD